jgi:hypothetical protein
MLRTSFRAGGLVRALSDVVSPYYRDSGGFSPVRLPIAVAGSLLTAIVLG